MDIATLAGLLLGGVLIIASIVMGGPIGAFIDIPSVLIVLGGTIASTMVRYPLNRVMGLMGLIMKTIFSHAYPYTEEIKRFSEFAKIAKREGLLALEQKAQEIKDPFLTKGLQLLVDGSSSEVLNGVLGTEIEYIKERHGVGKGILESMGAVAPAFGMIGTLIGLILMLGNLDDPDAIGPGMAVALITTFYGVLLANLVFIPFAGKLEGRSKEELLHKEMIMQGVLSLQAGDSPLVIEDKLRSFLANSLRGSTEKGGAAKETPAKEEKK